MRRPELGSFAAGLAVALLGLLLLYTAYRYWQLP